MERVVNDGVKLIVGTIGDSITANNDKKNMEESLQENLDAVKLKAESEAEGPHWRSIRIR